MKTLLYVNYYKTSKWHRKEQLKKNFISYQNLSEFCYEQKKILEDEFQKKNYSQFRIINSCYGNRNLKGVLTIAIA